MKELQNENGHFEEEACSLFDKVNSNDCDTCIDNALFARNVRREEGGDFGVGGGARNPICLNLNRIYRTKERKHSV